MVIIKRIKTLKGVGVLADKGAKDQSPNFLRFNLLYGFNGSGKSTLSRIFGCHVHTPPKIVASGPTVGREIKEAPPRRSPRSKNPR